MVLDYKCGLCLDSGFLPKAAILPEPPDVKCPNGCNPKNESYLEYKQRELISSLVAKDNEINQLRATIAEQQARIAELEKDAARYRWLRDECVPETNPQHTWILESPGDMWDAAIDKAMQGETI